MAGVLELVIFMVVLYCVFNSRASAMVDVLSARMQAVYTNWDQRPKSPPIRKVSTNSFRRFSHCDRRDKFRVHNSEILQQQRDRELFRSKESPWIQGFPSRPTRPFMGLACKACTPDSKDHSFDLSAKNVDVKNILKTETEKSGSFLTRVFCHIVHIWRFQKFDFPQVFDKVLVDSRLRDAIEDTTNELVENAIAEEKGSKDSDAEELYNKILVSQELRARNILLDMRSTLSDLLLRITTWLLYKLFPRFLTSVCLHPSHLAMLQKAAKTNLPLIFVPLHRSHLDYILITFILQNIRVKSPLVAAGNNLRIPVFGWLLRGLGAFFIKRRIDPVTGRKDILYRAVLQTYMVECLRAGHNIEFYIEGGRTRTGKPCMPKGGLLSVIIGAYMDGTIEDALLVPVSVNYDKLVDGNFISELLGQPKQMETFSSAISAIWTTLRSNYGCIRIDFNQPFSLKELVKSFHNLNRPGRVSQTDFFGNNDTDSSPIRKNGLQKEKSFRSVPSTTSLYGTDIVDESHRALVDKIARHLIYDCAKACAVMSTNSLAFLLLNKYRDGVSLDKLVIAFDQLRQQLLSDNRDVGFSGESIDVIEHAIKLLGPNLVKREMKEIENSTELVEIITPVTTLPNVIGLSYYSNTLVTHYMVEGVVATAISSSVKTDTASNLTVSLDEIMRNAVELCEILQFEFIFAKPCEPLEYVISDVIDKFKYMEIITTEEIFNMEFEEWTRTVPKLSEDTEDDEFSTFKPSPVFIINDTPAEVEKFELFHTILRPLIDTYLATAMCLHKLVDKQLTELEFTHVVLGEIKNQLLKGYSSFGESSSVDAIKNALKLFKKWHVIEMYNRDSVILVYLTDPYNSEEALHSVVKRIVHFKFLAGEMID